MLYQYKLSLNAISGTKSEDCLRVRALIQNQVKLRLIDSGNSTSFISQSMVDRLHLPTKNSKPVRVKVANGEVMASDNKVKEVEWWSSGHM